MKEECPYCAEEDELIDHDGEKMCPLCAEHFQNESDQYEDDMRKAEKGHWDEYE